MIHFPTTLGALAAAEGELRAGGTDLMERRKSGRASGAVVDLRDMPGQSTIEALDGGLRIGAGVRIAALAAHSLTPSGLAAAAGGLATPQIRAVATVGGNLAQRVRCWYLRNPGFTCLQSGGSRCPAREGDHLFHGCFDTGACIAPHPSTLATALLAQDATVELADRAGPMPLLDALEALATHAFGAPGREFVTAVRVPAPFPAERAAYLRVTSRSRAEWPLVEVSVRLGVDAGRVTVARVVVGGVAATPLRRPGVEARLLGKPLDDATIAYAAQAASEGASPLPMTGYKVALLVGAVQTALERAAGRG